MAGRVLPRGNRCVMPRRPSLTKIWPVDKLSNKAQARSRSHGSSGPRVAREIPRFSGTSADLRCISSKRYLATREGAEMTLRDRSNFWHLVKQRKYTPLQSPIAGAYGWKPAPNLASRVVHVFPQRTTNRAASAGKARQSFDAGVC